MIKGKFLDDDEMQDFILIKKRKMKIIIIIHKYLYVIADGI